MSEVDISGWAEFRVGTLFPVIERAKRRTVNDYAPGDTPYVTNSAANNGVSGYLQPKSASDIETGRCITVNTVDGSAFWQEKDFLANSSGNGLLMLRNGDMNELRALFVCAVITSTLEAGFRVMLTTDVVRDAKILLPVTSAGAPDWPLMEDMMRSVMADRESALRELSGALTGADKEMDLTDWRDFTLPGLFDIDMGSGLDFGKMTPSDAEDAVLFVGRTGINNGVMGAVEVVRDAKLYDAGAITVALGGSIGASFVQEAPFHTSQNVAVLVTKKSIGDNAKRFVASAIQKESSLNYRAFVRELNAHLRNDFTIRLPADANGDPDWESMEAIMRAITIERERALDAFLRLEASS